MKKILSAVLALSLCAVASAQEEYPTYLSLEDVAESQVLLPPPPQPGSVEFLLDEYEFHKAKLLRETPRGRQAVEDANMTDTPRKFIEAADLPLTKEEMPATYELLKRSQECFGSHGCHGAKNFYKRTRPFAYYGEDSFTPQADAWLVNNGSYPSGHSANYYGIAAILCALRPARQTQIMMRADEGAYSRVIVGVHWYSDIRASRLIALSVYARLQACPEFMEQFRKAQAEVARILEARESVAEAA